MDVGDEIVAKKVTAEYVNALQITANKIHVIDTTGKTIFKADGTYDEEAEATRGEIQIAGFKVDDRRIYSHEDESEGITIKSPEHKINSKIDIYASTNQAIGNSISIAKLTATRDLDNFELYIRNDGEEKYDYTIVSEKNVDFTTDLNLAYATAVQQAQNAYDNAANALKEVFLEQVAAVYGTPEQMAEAATAYLIKKGYSESDAMNRAEMLYNYWCDDSASDSVLPTL